MRLNDFKKNSAITVKLLSLLATFAVFGISLAVLLIPQSLGWLSRNDNTDASSLSFGATTTTLTSYYRIPPETSWTLLSANGAAELFAEIAPAAPGDTVEIQIQLINTTGHAVTLSEFGIAAADETEEVGKTVDGVTYYLSTQLTVQMRELRLSAVALSQSSEASYLSHTGAGGEWINQNVNCLPAPIEVPVNGVLEFTLVFEFVDNGENQNVYRDFGGAEYFCRRRLYGITSE